MVTFSTNQTQPDSTRPTGLFTGTDLWTCLVKISRSIDTADCRVRERHLVYLSQRPHTDSILHRYGLDDLEPLSIYVDPTPVSAPRHRPRQTTNSAFATSQTLRSSKISARFDGEYWDSGNIRHRSHTKTAASAPIRGTRTPLLFA